MVSSPSFTLPVLPPATPTTPTLQLHGLPPPTPAASPSPPCEDEHYDFDTQTTPSRPKTCLPSGIIPNLSDSYGFYSYEDLVDNLRKLAPLSRRRLLDRLVANLDSNDLMHLSLLLSPRLKRDFLSDLPPEVSLLILSFIDDPVDLVRCARVCKTWRRLVSDEQTWKTMCDRSGLSYRRSLLGRVHQARRQQAGHVDNADDFDEYYDEDAELDDYYDDSSQTSGYLVAEPTRPDVAKNSRHLIQQETFRENKPVTSDHYYDDEVDEVALNVLRHLDLHVDSLSRLSRSWRRHDQKHALQRSSSTSPSFRDNHSHFPFPESSYTENTSNASSSTIHPSYPLSTSLDTQLRFNKYSKSFSKSIDPLVGTSSSSFTSNPDKDMSTYNQQVPKPRSFSYKTYFKSAYLTEQTWIRGPGRLLSSGDFSDESVGTSFGCDSEWIVVGMAKAAIHVFDGATGNFVKSLHGHDQGVWCLTLVSKGGGLRPRKSHSQEPSRENSPNVSLGSQAYPHTTSSAAQIANACGATRGYGQSGAVLVSGGCDRTVRVWDIESGICRYVLTGHVSTIRCLKVLYGRPIAVSGSRDATIRVWNIETGTLVHLLEGHGHSVRCLEVSGNKIASGSYDSTCRLWDADTGECLFVMQGHLHQIYSIAFDGELIVTGSLDSMVRVWSARTGQCLALLSGHTSLVGQVQLYYKVLVTGGSDGRVIVFDLETYECLFRLCAHDNSVTCLQFNEKFIVTGGNDGKTKLFDAHNGSFIRELQEPCEAVWRANFRDDKLIIVSKRNGSTVIDVRTFRPLESEL